MATAAIMSDTSGMYFQNRDQQTVNYSSSLHGRQMIVEVRQSVHQFAQPITALLAILAAEEIVATSLACTNGAMNLDSMVAWADEDTIELIADCFATDRRIVLVFKDNSVVVKLVSDSGVINYPPANRPYRLADHIRWLFGPQG